MRSRAEGTRRSRVHDALTTGRGRQSLAASNASRSTKEQREQRCREVMGGEVCVINPQNSKNRNRKLLEVHYDFTSTRLGNVELPAVPVL